MQITTLPNPTEAEKQHSLKVVDAIKRALGKDSKLSFSQYMQIALYAPGLGYYASDKYKFGEKGDFITAPEISPVFAQCFAHAFTEVLNQCDAKNILEFGAGRGTFAADCILALQEIDFTLDHYYILELSADLTRVQRATLKEAVPEFFDKITWLSHLPERGFSGVIFANEVLDAMPVHLFSKQSDQVQEVCVTLKEGRFTYTVEPSSVSLRDAVTDIEKDVGILPEGYHSEVNLWIKPWVKGLYECMDRGAVFLCDYGYSRAEYYSPSHAKGTLQCYYKHQVHDDPLIYPGLQDITAHVDFAAVAIAADDCRFDLEGYLTQGEFLVLNNIAEHHNKMMASESNDLKKMQLKQALKKLTLPDGMGDMFKVIAFSKNIPDELLCFEKMNLLHKL